MELCVQKATPLSQDNGRCIISTAPSVPTHDPTKVLEDTEQPSLSAQTTAEASQDSDRVFDSSSIPSNTASTAASSLSQPYLTSLQEKSTLDLSNSLRSQDHVVIDIDSIQVISTQLPAKEPTLIPKLAKGSKTQANVENQDQDDGIGAEPQSRQPFEASKTSRMVACTDSYVAHQHDLAILSGNKSDSQPDRVQVSPETTASTSQLAGAQAEPAHFPKLTQVSKGKHPLFRYKQKAYISPTMPMSQDILDRWELRIKLRLEDAICQTMHDMNATDGSLSIDCFMAGHTESNLKPTIVIGCSTDRLRRKLLKQIKRFVWIPENGFECMVIEGLTPMLAASSTSVTSSALASASSTSQHSDGGLSGGAIAGISIGALVFGLSLMCCGCWWYRKRRMMRALAVESLNHQLQRQGLDKYDLDGMVRGDLQPYGAELNLDLASELELRQETNELTEMSQNNVPTESKGKLASLPPRIQETQKMKAANSGSAHSVHTKAPDAKRSIKLHNIGITQKYATTLCASLLRTLTPEMKPRVSTLGGLILVDDKVYGLSVAHSPTFDGLANDDSENPCNSVVEDEGDDYDDVGSDETLFVEFQPGVTTDCEYRPASHTQNKDRNRTSPLSRRDGDENGMITSKVRKSLSPLGRVGLNPVTRIEWTGLYLQSMIQR